MNLMTENLQQERLMAPHLNEMLSASTGSRRHFSIEGDLKRRRVGLIE